MNTNTKIKNVFKLIFKAFAYLTVSILIILLLTSITLSLFVDEVVYRQFADSLMMSMIFTNFSIRGFRYFFPKMNKSENKIKTIILGFFTLLFGFSAFFFAITIYGAIQDLPGSLKIIILILSGVIIIFVQIIPKIIKKSDDKKQKIKLQKIEKEEEIKKEKLEQKNREELNVLNRIEKFQKKSKKMDETFISFISYSTLKYDNSEKKYEDITEYNEKLNEFSNYIRLPEELEMKLPDYLNIEKIEIYYEMIVEELSRIISLEESSNEEIITKFYEIYGVNATKNHNIEALSRLTDQEPYTIKLIMEDIKLNSIYLKEKRMTESRLFGTNILDHAEEINSMNGFEFEDFLEKLFNDMGYKTETLPYTGDYGADLIVFWNHKKIIIQAKKYSEGNATSLPAIQEVQAAKSYYNGDLAMVITTSHFTKNAIVLAERAGVSLINGKELKTLISEKNTYFSKIVSSATND